MLALILSGCSDPEQEGKVTYDVVFRESLAGTYVKEQVGEQKYAYSYQYTDRGWGPDLTEELVLNDRGMINFQSIKGVNYRKTPSPAASGACSLTGRGRCTPAIPLLNWCVPAFNGPILQKKR